MRSRKRRYREKKPNDPRSLLVAMPAAVSIIFYLMALILSVRNEGSIGRFIPAIGVLLLLISFFLLYYGIREVKQDDFSKISRILGAVLPLISLLIWLIVFLAGLLF